jgi:Tol biopolymer transport system component
MLIAGATLVFGGCGGPPPTATALPTASVQSTATVQPTATVLPTRSVEIDPELVNSMLAYSSGSAASADIYVARADGSDERRLTFGAGTKIYPAWSPDGTRIVYRVETPDPQPSTPDFDKTGTLVVALDGSGVVSVTATSRVLGGVMSWSPDGTMMAVGGRHEADPPRAESIWTMNADGSGTRRLTPEGVDAQQPAWSPDGQRIAFTVAEEGRFMIYVMNADGTDSRRLTTGPQDEGPMWSPDGSMIAFFRGVGGTDLWLMNPDGSGQRATNATTGHDCGTPASWASPSFISFSCGGGGPGFVAAIRLDGTDFTILLGGREAGFPAFAPNSIRP